MQPGGAGAPAGQFSNDGARPFAPVGNTGYQQQSPAVSQFPGSPAPQSAQLPPQTGIDVSGQGNFAQPGNAPAVGGAPGSSPQGRVDPEQIPSVPRSRDAAAQYYLDHIYPTLEHHLPPPGSVAFIAHDQGNSSPKFTRLTMNNIPSTSEALHSTGLPLGLL
ncbi:MAG: hypothetical protein M4579_007673, partial [Chaenotheca gracillima]